MQFPNRVQTQERAIASPQTSAHPAAFKNYETLALKAFYSPKAD
ncbi:hypothetical protein [Laspinema sp. D2d]|nr:hypothetical protein [Laspinema sp. D2d]